MPLIEQAFASLRVSARIDAVARVQQEHAKAEKHGGQIRELLFDLAIAHGETMAIPVRVRDLVRKSGDQRAVVPEPAQLQTEMANPVVHSGIPSCGFKPWIVQRDPLCDARAALAEPGE